MRFLVPLVASTLLAATARAQLTPIRTPILVELFTSEGCSSCPTADAMLAKMESNQSSKVEIIALGEHVDYWDQLGWHDRFSSHQFTDRQNLYSAHFRLDSVFTPQMVVDGTYQFSGNDSGKAVQAVVHASTVPKLALTLAPPSLDGRKLTSTVSLDQPASNNATVWAALVQPHASTQVRSGENGGHTLTHVAVVRALVRVGSLKDAGRHPLAVHLTAPPDTNPAELRLVVFAQADTLDPSGTGPSLGPILAIATSTPKPPQTEQAAR